MRALCCKVLSAPWTPFASEFYLGRMRLALFTDSHLGYRYPRISRSETGSNLLAFRECLYLSQALRCDAILHAGDFYDNPGVSSDMQISIIEVMRAFRVSGVQAGSSRYRLVSRGDSWNYVPYARGSARPFSLGQVSQETEQLSLAKAAGSGEQGQNVSDTLAGPAFQEQSDCRRVSSLSQYLGSSAPLSARTQSTLLKNRGFTQVEVAAVKANVSGESGCPRGKARHGAAGESQAFGFPNEAASGAADAIPFLAIYGNHDLSGKDLDLLQFAGTLTLLDTHPANAKRLAPLPDGASHSAAQSAEGPSGTQLLEIPHAGLSRGATWRGATYYLDPTILKFPDAFLVIYGMNYSPRFSDLEVSLVDPREKIWDYIQREDPQSEELPVVSVLLLHQDYSDIPGREKISLEFIRIYNREQRAIAALHVAAPGAGIKREPKSESAPGREAQRAEAGPLQSPTLPGRGFPVQFVVLGHEHDYAIHRMGGDVEFQILQPGSVHRRAHVVDILKAKRQAFQGDQPHFVLLDIDVSPGDAGGAGGAGSASVSRPPSPWALARDTQRSQAIPLRLALSRVHHAGSIEVDYSAVLREIRARGDTDDALREILQTEVARHTGEVLSQVLAVYRDRVAKALDSLGAFFSAVLNHQLRELGPILTSALEREFAGPRGADDFSASSVAVQYAGAITLFEELLPSRFCSYIASMLFSGEDPAGAVLASSVDQEVSLFSLFFAMEENALQTDVFLEYLAKALSKRLVEAAREAQGSVHNFLRGEAPAARDTPPVVSSIGVQPGTGKSKTCFDDDVVQSEGSSILPESPDLYLPERCGAHDIAELISQTRKEAPAAANQGLAASKSQYAASSPSDTVQRNLCFPVFLRGSEVTGGPCAAQLVDSIGEYLVCVLAGALWGQKREFREINSKLVSLEVKELATRFLFQEKRFLRFQRPIAAFAPTLLNAEGISRERADAVRGMSFQKLQSEEQCFANTSGLYNLFLVEDEAPGESPAVFSAVEQSCCYERLVIALDQQMRDYRDALMILRQEGQEARSRGGAVEDGEREAEDPGRPEDGGVIQLTSSSSTIEVLSSSEDAANASRAFPAGASDAVSAGATGMPEPPGQLPGAEAAGHSHSAGTRKFLNSPNMVPGVLDDYVRRALRKHYLATEGQGVPDPYPETLEPETLRVPALGSGAQPRHNSGVKGGLWASLDQRKPEDAVDELSKRHKAEVERVVAGDWDLASPTLFRDLELSLATLGLELSAGGDS